VIGDRLVDVLVIKQRISAETRHYSSQRRFERIEVFYHTFDLMDSAMSADLQLPATLVVLLEVTSLTYPTDTAASCTSGMLDDGGISTLATPLPRRIFEYQLSGWCVLTLMLGRSAAKNRRIRLTVQYVFRSSQRKQSIVVLMTL
jgi:hypothetical protein